MKKITESQKVQNLIHWGNFFIIDGKQRMRAGSLTYFSLIGLVPFCSFILWLATALKTDPAFTPIFDEMFPHLKETFLKIFQYAQVNNETLFSTWVGWVAAAIIIYFVYCSFFNIQRVFNEIWKSEERKEPANLAVIVSSAFVCAITVFLCSFIFSIVKWLPLKLFFCAVVIASCIAAAFYYLPFDKKPSFKSVAVSSVITTILLFLWAYISSYLANFVATYQSDGLLIFFLIFCVYWAWYIILFGAKFCRYLYKRNSGISLYIKDEISDLSPHFICYLSIAVTSYVFRNSRISNGGVTFEEIMDSMTKAVDKKNQDRKEFLIPMPLLDRILDNLCDSRHIISRNVIDGTVKYAPSENIQISEYTTGDFLHDYYVAGKSLSGFPSYGRKDGLSSKISELWKEQRDLVVDVFEGFPHILENSAQSKHTFWDSITKMFRNEE